MTISLRHRAGWVVAGGLAGLALAAVLDLGVAGLVVLTLLGAAVVAVGVAANSYRRHSADPDAQPQEQSQGGYTVSSASRSSDHPH